MHRIDLTKVTEGKLTLVDLQYQVRAWEYTGVDRLRSAGSECWCLTQASKEQPAKLMLLTLPGKELHEQVAKAITEPDYYVLPKGGAVKLDLTGLPAADRKAVVTLVEKRLSEKQVTVGPESDVTLVFNMGATRERKRTAFAPGDNEVRTWTYTFRQKSVEVTVEFKGQPVHSMVLYSEPVKSGTRQPNESLQQFHDRNPMPIPEIVRYITLPKVMFGPKGNKFIGTTNVAETAKVE